jgi:hypothetical protein
LYKHTIYPIREQARQRSSRALVEAHILRIKRCNGSKSVAERIRVA